MLVVGSGGSREIILNLPQKRRGGPEEGMTRSGPPVDGYYRNSSESKCSAITKSLRHSNIVRTFLLFLAAVTGYCLVTGIRELDQSDAKGIGSANVASNFGVLDDDKDLSRLNDYCPVTISHGSEGILSPTELKSDMKLKYILINIRHGDRSAIHAMPGSAPLSVEIPKEGPYLVPNALDFRTHMKSFKLEKIPSKSGKIRLLTTTAAAASGNSDSNSGSGKQTSAAADSVLPDSLNHSVLFSVSDYHLKQGQLTTRGFMQHITLGGILRRSYSAFLSSHIKSSANLYVRSTKYDRTFQSVAALLTALLPNLLKPDKTVSCTHCNDRSVEGTAPT